MPLNIQNDPLSVMPHLSHLRLATVSQPEQCLTLTPGVRGPRTALGLTYADSGRGGPPVPRPFLGGPKTGFHTMPALGDQVLVALQPKFHPVGTLSATVHPELLDVLQPGESLQRHPDGRVADFLKKDGTTVLYSDLTGTTLVADGVNKITATATTVAITGKTKTGTFELTNTTPGGSMVLNGTISGTGTDPQGGTVTITGTCQVTFPAVWNLVINGATHQVALLS